MDKELYFYTPFYTSFTEDLIAQLELVRQLNNNIGVIIRLNCIGGSVPNSYGVYAKMRETSKAGHKVTIKVDGRALSGGFNMLLFADQVDSLDVSEFLLHRAAMEDETNMTVEEKAQLQKVNNDLKNILLSKVSADKFYQVTKRTIEEVFALDSRIDVRMDAYQAKELGIVNNIYKLSSEMDLVAFHGGNKQIEASIKEYTTNKTEANPVKMANKKMTIEDLKRDHPSLYAQVAEEVSAQAAKKERDRLASLTPFLGIDENLINTKINDGTYLTESERSELSIKLVKAQFQSEEKKAIEAAITEQAKAVETSKVEQGAEAKSQEDLDYEALKEEMFKKFKK